MSDEPDAPEAEDANEADAEKPKPPLTWWGWLRDWSISDRAWVGIYIAAPMLVSWVYAVLVGIYFDKHDERGTFGDQFGVLNAIFSAFALVAVVISLRKQSEDLGLQREDLALQRKEAQLTRKVLEEQLEVMEKQGELAQAQLDQIRDQPYRGALHAAREDLAIEAERMRGRLDEARPVFIEAERQLALSGELRGHQVDVSGLHAAMVSVMGRDPGFAPVCVLPEHVNSAREAWAAMNLEQAWERVVEGAVADLMGNIQTEAFLGGWPIELKDQRETEGEQALLAWGGRLRPDTSNPIPMDR